MSSATFMWHGRFGLPAANRDARDYYLRDLFVPRSRTESLLTPVVRRFDLAADLFLGRRESRPAAELNGIDETIRKRLGSDEGVDLLLLTDYSHSNRGQLVAFVFGKDEPRPIAVAKARTSPSGREALRREYITLEDLWADAKFRSSIPKPLALDETDGETVLLESAVPGRSIYFILRNERPSVETISEHFSLVFDWLHKFQTGLPRKQVSLREVAPAAEVLLALGELTDAEKGLIERLAKKTQDEGAKKVPIAAIQGDFWVRNILLDGRSLAVIDWENYKSEGLPLDDALTFLISYGEGFQWRFGRWERPEEAFRRMFNDQRALRPLVMTQLEQFCSNAGMEPDLLPTLIEIFLVKHAAEEAGQQNSSEEVTHWRTLLRMYAEMSGEFSG